MTGFWPSRISQCFLFFSLYFFRRIFHVSAKQRTGEQNGERATTTVSQYTYNNNNYQIFGQKIFQLQIQQMQLWPLFPPLAIPAAAQSQLQRNREKIALHIAMSVCINVRVSVRECVCAGPPRNVKSEIVRRP